MVLRVKGYRQLAVMLIPLLLVAPMETVVAMDTACSHSLDLVCVQSGKVCLYMNIDKDHLIHSDLESKTYNLWPH